MSNKIPSEGETLWIHGREMVASYVMVTPEIDYATGKPTGRRIVRFTGTCTKHPSNDPIRHTSYNGGRYGWALTDVEVTP